MDPALQFLSTTVWGSVGGWGMAIALGIYLLTGFTLRGWETPKMRVRREAREDAANVRNQALQDQLNSERKETADKALEANLALATTVQSQQGTISTQDSFLKKVPVSTPISGGARSRGSLAASEGI